MYAQTIQLAQFARQQLARQQLAALLASNLEARPPPIVTCHCAAVPVHY